MKQTLFEHAARVPFMLGGAGVEARGRNCMRTVELIDIYPTLARSAGFMTFRRTCRAAASRRC